MQFKTIINAIVAATKVIEVGMSLVSKVDEQHGRVPVLVAHDRLEFTPDAKPTQKAALAKSLGVEPGENFDARLKAAVIAENSRRALAHRFLEPKGTAVDPGDYRVELEDGRVYFVDGPMFEAFFEPADAKRQAEALAE